MLNTAVLFEEIDEVEARKILKAFCEEIQKCSGDVDWADPEIQLQFAKFTKKQNADS